MSNTKAPTNMKLFTAIRINKKDADTICKYAESMLEYTIESAEDLHITLQYLGEQADVNSIMSRLANVAYEPLRLTYEQFHSFSNMPVCSNVIWQGVRDDENHLHKLHELTSEYLRDIDYEKSRPYTPHITVCYTEDTIEPCVIDTLCSPLYGKQFLVDSFELCEVLDDSCRPHFRTVAHFKLDPGQTRKTAQILWVNDLHGSISETDTEPGTAKLAAAIRDYVHLNPDTKVIFGGDNFFGDPVSDMFKGIPVAEAMKAMNVSASVIGNHDFDVEDMDLRKCSESGNFDFIAANLQSENSESVCDSIILKINGFNIGILGLSTKEPLPGPDHPECWNAYSIEDGTGIAEQFLEECDCDAKIAATHYGLRETSCGGFIGDEALKLLDLNDGFDGIFTAHMHQAIQFSKGKTAVLQAGCKGRYYGVIRMTFSEKRQLLSAIPLLYKVDQSVEPDPDIQSMNAAWIRRAMTKLNRQVGFASENLPHRDSDFHVPLSGTALTKIASDCMIEVSECDIALLYSGRVGFEGFKQGPITLYEYKKQFPFKNSLAKLKLTGGQISKILEAGFRTAEEGLPSPIAVGGITVIIAPERQIGNRIIRIMDKEGRELRNDIEYDVVTENYLLTDPFQIPLSQGKDVKYLEENLNSLVLNYFLTHPSIKNEVPANIIIQRR